MSLQDLINICFDKTARGDERHDALMYLFDYDEEEVLETFLKIATNPLEEGWIIEAAAEGVGEYLSRNPFAISETIEKLPKNFRSIARNIISLRKENTS